MLWRRSDEWTRYLTPLTPLLASAPTAGYYNQGRIEPCPKNVVFNPSFSTILVRVWRQSTEHSSTTAIAELCGVVTRFFVEERIEHVRKQLQKNGAT